MNAAVELGRLLEALCLATNPPHAPREHKVAIDARPESITSAPRETSGDSRPDPRAAAVPAPPERVPSMTAADCEDPVFAYRYLRGLRASRERSSIASGVVHPLPDAVTLAAPVGALCEIAPGWLACGDHDGVIRIVTRSPRGRWDCAAVIGRRSDPIVQLLATGEREFVSVDAAGVVEAWRPGSFCTWTASIVQIPPNAIMVRVVACGAMPVLVYQSGADCVVLVLERHAMYVWSAGRRVQFPGTLRAADAIDDTHVAIACEESLHTVQVSDPIRVVDTLGMQGAAVVVLGLRRRAQRTFAAFGLSGGMTIFEQQAVESASASSVDPIASRWVIKAYLSLPSATVQSATELPSGDIAAFGSDNSIAIMTRRGAQKDNPEWEQIATLNARPSYGPMIVAGLCDGRIAFTDASDIAIGQSSATGGWITRAADRLTSYNGYALIEPLDDKTLAAWRPGEAITLIDTREPPAATTLGTPETAMFAIARLSDNELIVSTTFGVQLQVRAGDGPWIVQSLPQTMQPPFAPRVVPIGKDAFLFFSTFGGSIIQQYTRHRSTWSSMPLSLVSMPSRLERVIVFEDTVLFVGDGGLQIIQRRPDGELASSSPPIPFNAIAPTNVTSPISLPPIAAFVVKDAAPHERGVVVLMDDGTVAHIRISDKGIAQVSAWLRVDGGASSNRMLVRNDGWIALLGESRSIRWLKIDGAADSGTIRDAGVSMPLLAAPRTALLIGDFFTISTDAGLYQIEPPETSGGDKWMSWVIDADAICETEHRRKEGIVMRHLFPRDPARGWRVEVVGSENAGYASASDYRLHPYLGVITRDGRVIESWQTSDDSLQWVGQDGNGASSLNIRGAPPQP